VAELACIEARLRGSLQEKENKPEKYLRHNLGILILTFIDHQRLVILAQRFGF
jgi:hypothetical protein